MQTKFDLPTPECTLWYSVFRMTCSVCMKLYLNPCEILREMLNRYTGKGQATINQTLLTGNICLIEYM